MSDTRTDLLHRIIGFKDLAQGWDGYDGATPTELARKIAAIIVSRDPVAVPTSDGGVQLEWWGYGGLNIEVHIQHNGEVETMIAPHSPHALTRDQVDVLDKALKDSTTLVHGGEISDKPLI